MSEQKLENWMHASDEERLAIHTGWDVANDEGRDIAEGVAGLLIKECVYDICDVAVISSDGKWQILAHADSDYESLKSRDIDFLGFELVIEKAAV